VHVWCAALDRPTSELPALARLLSTDERERAEQFRFAHDQHRFTVGRATLRLLLARYIDHAPHAIRFQQGPQGKPMLATELDAQAGAHALHFNMSHSAGLALYAFARGHQVGVDIEYVRPLDDAEQIAARYFSAEEYAALLQLVPTERLEAFFACWTRKEAYVKAIGEGLSRPLKEFSVSLAPGERAALLHVAGDPTEARRWQIEALAPAQEYVGALAVDGHALQVDCWRVAEGT
jgi:4'-phosphopantetheinyl transferase